MSFSDKYPDLRISKSVKTVYQIQSKTFLSLLGVARHRARIKIACRLGQYFREQGEIERKNAPAVDYGWNHTHASFEAEYYPTKHRYKLMRERLARTIARKLREGGLQ